MTFRLDSAGPARSASPARGLSDRRAAWLARRALDLLVVGAGIGLALPLIVPFA